MYIHQIVVTVCTFNSAKGLRNCYSGTPIIQHSVAVNMCTSYCKGCQISGEVLWYGIATMDYIKTWSGYRGCWIMKAPLCQATMHLHIQYICTCIRIYVHMYVCTCLLIILLSCWLFSECLYFLSRMNTPANIVCHAREGWVVWWRRWGHGTVPGRAHTTAQCVGAHKDRTEDLQYCVPRDHQTGGWTGVCTWDITSYVCCTDLTRRSIELLILSTHVCRCMVYLYVYACVCTYCMCSFVCIEHIHVYIRTCM